MLDYKKDNDIERAYFNQDFAPLNELFKVIRAALVSGKPINLTKNNLQEAMETFAPRAKMVYVRLFQAGVKSIRYGSGKKPFNYALDSCVKNIRGKKTFCEFDVANPDVCRIMIEFIIDGEAVDYQKLQISKFDETRFEPGITGLKMEAKEGTFYFTPADSIIQNNMGIKTPINFLFRNTEAGKTTNKISQRLELLKSSKEKYKFSTLKSRAFITYKDKCIPLYRGNKVYDEFNYDTVLDIFKKSTNWLLENLHEDGKFLYYYDCAQDTQIDHEHPNREPDNLYYNDLRHSGASITLLRAYELTKDPKFLEAAKLSFKFSFDITREHKVGLETAYYTFCNEKSKLGGVGVLLVALMMYRNITGDKSYDDYIKGYVRHLLSRICKSGEFMGYYIHPAYNNGEPLETMSDKDRMETFSFYYPGEALLGLGLFANHFDGDDKLVQKTKKDCEKALDWIVDKRPLTYQHLFTALPSDSWLMQAIEEWVEDPHFRKSNYLRFVYNDANEMINRQYKKDDSPYIDYEGAFYYNYGDHYYPDGARSEGLVAAYYLADKMGEKELAQKYLEACELAAKSQFMLFNSPEYSYAHKNPAKSINTIRFKPTRQWIRIDSIQHVACFYARLYSKK